MEDVRYSIESSITDIVAEQLTQDDAASGVLTFEEDIEGVEIWHNEGTLQTFIVNGMSLKIAGGGWRSPVAGTSSNEVTIPTGITCTVARLI